MHTADGEEEWGDGKEEEETAAAAEPAEQNGAGST